jgi:excisionase family DNA binding protein
MAVPFATVERITPLSIPSIGLGHDPGPTPFFHTVRETERLLRLSHATIYRLIGQGRLDAKKVGARTLISRTSIERFAAELPAA